MCFPTAIAAMLGLSFVGCDASGDLGPDPLTQTEAITIALPHKERGYLIKCPKSTASCITRAQAICQGRFNVIPPIGRGPKVQALIDLEIRVIDTDNPSEIRIACT